MISIKKAALLIGFLVLLIGYRSEAQATTYKLQAVYLFNFAKYIKWTTDSPTFVIGVLGNADVVDFLQTTLQVQRVGNKLVKIKRLINLNDISQCQIVYLSKSKSKQLPAIIDRAASKEILVVTEEDFSRKGAGISFFVEDNTLKFKLNPYVLTKSGLIASSGLLSLSTVVYEK